MNEAELTRKIVKALNELPYCYAVKIHGGPHQAKGLPDVVGCYNGRFFGLEVKLPGKESTLTDIQKNKLTKISQAGGTSGMVTTVRGAIYAVTESSYYAD